MANPGVPSEHIPRIWLLQILRFQIFKFLYTITGQSVILTTQISMYVYNFLMIKISRITVAAWPDLNTRLLHIANGA